MFTGLAVHFGPPEPVPVGLPLPGLPGVPGVVSRIRDIDRHAAGPGDD